MSDRLILHKSIARNNQVYISMAQGLHSWNVLQHTKSGAETPDNRKTSLNISTANCLFTEIAFRSSCNRHFFIRYIPNLQSLTSLNKSRSIAKRQKQCSASLLPYRNRSKHKTICFLRKKLNPTHHLAPSLFLHSL